MSNKRSREELGFNSHAAKTAAKLGGDICILMGESVQYTHDTLAACKTLKDFKRAREAIETHSTASLVKLATLVLKMASDNAEAVEEDLAQPLVVPNPNE